MNKLACPRYLRDIETKVEKHLKRVKKTSSELLEKQQSYYDEVLNVYQRAFQDLINNAITYSSILQDIKKSYEDSLSIRNERISQFIIQDSVFGITKRKNQYDKKIKMLITENDNLKEENMRLNFEISKLETNINKSKHDNFSDYLALMKERDARYTLFFENLNLQMRLKELDGSSDVMTDSHGDPVILRIALDRCRKQLSQTQSELKKMAEEYSETVPQREHDALMASNHDAVTGLAALKAEHQTLQETYKRVAASIKSLEEELSETKDRCHELERAGTPRPQWELCADFIGGGWDRWCQLASGLSSRDTLRVLLKELGPAAESDHLEHFDGLGMDPSIPPYLRYEGKVRNLRLSRREVSVIINDIWQGKLQHDPDMPMQDYVTKYFEDRYGQASVRAEWAYNLCAGAEQMLDEPQVRVFWGALRGRRDPRAHQRLRDGWRALRDRCVAQAKDGQTITLEELEKIVKAVFPLKSEVEVKNLSDVVKKHMKLKTNFNEVNLDKLFQENEEGFERSELSRELYRQRRASQRRYIREVLAALRGAGGAGGAGVTVEELKRAFAIVDPAIDHIQMDHHVRWAFGIAAGSLEGAGPLPARALAARLVAGDIERAGPRHQTKKRGYKFTR